MRLFISPISSRYYVLLLGLSVLAVPPSEAFVAPQWAVPHGKAAPSAGRPRECAVSLSAREVSALYDCRRPQAPLVMRPRCISYSNLPSRPCSLPLPLTALSSTASPEDESLSVGGEVAAAASSEDSPTEDRSLLKRIRSYFAPKKDGLTFRQRLAKMGLAAVLSYGWVSNMSYCVTVSLAWYIFSKQTKMSPLAPGQWKGFLAVYAGFWVFNNVVRPIRLAVSVAISPQFDRIVLGIQNRLKVSKAAAITTVVILANLIGTTFFMATGILVASILAGVPIFPR